MSIFDIFSGWMIFHLFIAYRIVVEHEHTVSEIQLLFRENDFWKSKDIPNTIEHEPPKVETEIKVNDIKFAQSHVLHVSELHFYKIKFINNEFHLHKRLHLISHLKSST